jgi:hypothetical protein
VAPARREVQAVELIVQWQGAWSVPGEDHPDEMIESPGANQDWFICVAC